MTTENAEGSNSADEQLLTQFGYKQELKRTLKLFSMFAISFSVISVTTGIFTNFAFATSEFGAASIWLWPVAALGALVLSFVLAELASRIPLAGYSYQWAAPGWAGLWLVRWLRPALRLHPGQRRRGAAAAVAPRSGPCSD